MTYYDLLVKRVRRFSVLLSLQPSIPSEKSAMGCLEGQVSHLFILAY